MAPAPKPSNKENDLYAHVKSRVSTTSVKGERAPTMPAAAGCPHPAPVSRAPPRLPAPAPAPAPALAASLDLDALARPEDIGVPTTPGATLHDLTPEDKRKVAKLIKQVVEYADARKKLERELEQSRERLAEESDARRAAEAAEASRREEIDALNAKLTDALARIRAYQFKLKDAERALSLAQSAAQTESRRSRRTMTSEDADSSRGVSSGPVYAPPSVGSTKPSLPAPTHPPMSPATRAAVDEIRSALERTPPERERQRPPLAVGPTKPPAPPPTARGPAPAPAPAPRPGVETSSSRAAVPPPTPGAVPGLSPASSRDLRWLANVAKVSSDAGSGLATGSPKAARMSAAAAAAASAVRAVLSATPTVSKGSAIDSAPHTAECGSGSARVSAATPDIASEVRAAAAASVDSAAPASTVSSSPRPDLSPDPMAAALAAGVAAAAAAAAGEVWTSPPSPLPVTTDARADAGGGRVLRFDPDAGPAGRFYFGDVSFRSGGSVEDASSDVHVDGSGRGDDETVVAVDDDASGRFLAGASFSEEENRARSVRAVLGLPDDSPERAGVSSSAAKRALVALDDEFASYEARAAGRGAGTAAGRDTTRSPVDGSNASSNASSNAPPPASSNAPPPASSNAPPPAHPPASLNTPPPAPHPLSDRISSAPVTPVRAFDECLAGAAGPVATATASGDASLETSLATFLATSLAARVAPPPAPGSPNVPLPSTGMTARARVGGKPPPAPSPLGFGTGDGTASAFKKPVSVSTAHRAVRAAAAVVEAALAGIHEEVVEEEEEAAKEDAAEEDAAEEDAAEEDAAEEDVGVLNPPVVSPASDAFASSAVVVAPSRAPRSGFGFGGIGDNDDSLSGSFDLDLLDLVDEVEAMRKPRAPRGGVAAEGKKTARGCAQNRKIATSRGCARNASKTDRRRVDRGSAYAPGGSSGSAAATATTRGEWRTEYRSFTADKRGAALW